MMLSSFKKFTIVRYGWLVILLCATPLAGVLYLGQPLTPYLEFPPTTKYIPHASFCWPAFLLLAFFVGAVTLPFLYRVVCCGFSRRKRPAYRHSFPGWGWFGIALVLVFWVLAWNRYRYFQPLQRYTFFPLWMGYILIVNALTCKRQGCCLLQTKPRFFWLLFPASAIFWWYFEYLNRFVQNWYYSMGPGQVTATEYVIHATVCFSTVLPAVSSTREWLSTFAWPAQAFGNWYRPGFSDQKGIGWLLLAVATLALACLAAFPDYLFPFVWIAPLLVIVGMQLVNGKATFFAGLSKGDWRSVVLSGLAALICGFFWEMWNWKSLAH